MKSSIFSSGVCKSCGSPDGKFFDISCVGPSVSYAPIELERLCGACEWMIERSEIFAMERRASRRLDTFLEWNGG